MKFIIPLGTIAVLLLASCDQPDPQNEVASKTSRGSAKHLSVPDHAAGTGIARQAPGSAELQSLADRIYDVPDEELPELVESIAEENDAAVRQTMITSIYEESELRPPTVRLPVLLELARSADVAEDVRTTIMAELGATLKTNHGNSWADWALALEEHLAATEGLLRVE